MFFRIYRRDYLIALVIHIVILLSSSVAQSPPPDTLFLSYTSSEQTLHNNINTEFLNNAEEENTEDLFKWDFFSGDWGGLRSKLNKAGFYFEFNYKADLFSNFLGGIQKGSEYLDNFDIILSADLEKSINWGNTNLLIHFLGNGGGSACELVGASQGISNIEAVPTWKLYQFLIEKKFFNESLSLALGLYDLNSEFDVRETSSIFINPSHGIGDEFAKSGLNGPSIFPTTSVGLRVKYESVSGRYLQVVALDAVPGNLENPYGTHISWNKQEGLLLVSEIGLQNKENETLHSKIAVGLWVYSQKTITNTSIINDAMHRQNNFGFYFTAERVLNQNVENAGLGLKGFIRIGYANTNINPVDFYIGTGLNFSGLLNTDDKFGIAMAFAHNSSSYRKVAKLNDEIIKEYEINFEATYLLKLTPWLTIQPDIQYIVNPSYCTKSGNAFVVGSRFEINF